MEDNKIKTDFCGLDKVQPIDMYELSMLEDHIPIEPLIPLSTAFDKLEQVVSTEPKS